MKAGDRYISHAHLTIMASANFNEIIACHIYDMNDFNVLLSNALQDKVVRIGLLKVYQVNDFVFVMGRHYSIWEANFAQLAIESFPTVGFDARRV